MNKKRFIIILLVVVFTLVIPLVAMQFSNEVNWTPLDFMVAGTLLLGVGIISEITIRKINNIKYRIATLVLLLLFFLLTWIELAVGIIGI